MKKNATTKKIFLYLCREILIIFIPEMLSPLHIASHRYKINKSKYDIKLKKLKDEIIIIILNHKGCDYKVNDNTINLFFEVYNLIDNLSLDELKILHKYYYVLKEFNSYGHINYMGNAKNIIWNDYGEKISDYIDEIKLKTKNE